MSIPNRGANLLVQRNRQKMTYVSGKVLTPEELFQDFKAEVNSSDDIIDLLTKECGDLIDAPDDHHTMSLGADLINVYEDPVTKNRLLSYPTESNLLIIESISYIRLLAKQKVYVPVFIEAKPKVLWTSVKLYSINRVLLANMKSLINMIGPDMKINYHCEHLVCFSKALEHILPYITQLQLYFYHPRSEIYSNNPNDYPEPINVAEAINQIHKIAFEMAHDKCFIESQRERNRRTKHNLRTLQNYLNEIRRQHEVTLLLRFNLYLPANKSDLTTDEFKQLYNKFLQKLCRTKSLYVLGYIWKLDFGETQGLHYHCFFIFDGSKHQHHTDLAKKIVDMWCVLVSSNDGKIECNDPKYLGRYKSPLIGILDLNDAVKYTGLLKVLRYLCKRDQFMVHKSIHRKKTFGTGRLISKRKHLGRPRA